MADIKVVDKIFKDRNSDFLPSVKAALEGLEDGSVISMTAYVKYANGDTALACSYSNTPMEDAGELMAMAMNRMGFSRS